jgi:hypothetical protein
MIDVRRLLSTTAQVTGNSDVFVRVNGQLYPVKACFADRNVGSIVSRRLVLDITIPEPVEDGEVDVEPVAKRRGRPAKVVA